MTVKHVGFDNSASLSYTSLSTAYQNLLIMSDDADVLFLANSMDVSAYFSVPSALLKTGSLSAALVYKDIELLAGETITLDCRANQKRLAKGTIQVKYTGTAPTTGKVKAMVVR